MAIKARPILKGIYITGAKPTQQDFTDWLDSYLHVSDPLPAAGVLAGINAAQPEDLRSALRGVYYTQSGHEILVDKDSAQATDSRAGIGIYNTSVPFLTIQAAVTAAASGDTVIVGTGTYTEQVVIPAGRHLHLQLCNAIIQYNSDTSAVIACAGTAGALSITGLGICKIKNLGTGRAVEIQYAVSTSGYTYKFEHTDLETAGDWAVTWFTGGSSLNRYIFRDVHITGGMGYDNDGSTPDVEELSDCSITGHVRLHSSVVVKHCRFLGYVEMRQNLRFADCDFISAPVSYGPNDSRSYILDFFPLYGGPDAANVMFKNCTFKGNSLMFLRDGGGGWSANSIVKFTNCDFELTGPDGFSFWQYNISAHQVILSGCISNMDYGSGFNHAALGPRIKIYNSSFDTEYKTLL